MNLKNRWIWGEQIKDQRPKLLLKFPSLRTIKRIMSINQGARTKVRTNDGISYLKLNLYLEHRSVCTQAALHTLVFPKLLSTEICAAVFAHRVHIPALQVRG